MSGCIAIPALLLAGILAVSLLFSSFGNAAIGVSSIIAQLTGPLYLVVGLLSGVAIGFIGGAVFYHVRLEAKRVAGLPTTVVEQVDTTSVARLPKLQIRHKIVEPVQQTRAMVEFNTEDWGF